MTHLEARPESSPLSAAKARAQAEGVRDVPAILLGVAWYPEQWPETAWERDLSLMEEAGVRMVRIGEFAWSSLEPREGEFALDWVERAIVQAAP